MPEIAQGDPSGVPRPLAPERIKRAEANSGIMVGQEPTQTKTTAGTEQDGYKTAFIKVYQDAGVIGLAMLTLLALCVLLSLFSVRVLKMYATLVEANNLLVKTSSDATMKMAAAILKLEATVGTSVAEIRKDHDETDRLIIAASLKADASYNRVERLDEKISVIFDFFMRRPVTPALDDRTGDPV